MARTRRPMMTPQQFKRWTFLNGRVADQEKGPGRMTPKMWDEWRDLRDNYVLPPMMPEPGSPATYAIGSDRYAMEVVKAAPNGLKIWARRPGSKDEEGDCFTYRPTSGRYYPPT